METQVRLVILSLGLLILFGVAVDVYRRRKLSQSYNSFKRERENTNDLLDVSSELQPEDYIVDTIYAQDDINDELHLVQPEYEFSDLEIENISPYIADDPDPFEYSSPVTEDPTATPPSIQDLIAVFVMSRSPFGFDGNELYTAISKAHFHLGKNNLFYRYAHDDGKGEALFSLVKAVEPGYFNIDILRQEHVPGITFLMLPSKCNDPLLALDKLIRAAKQIAYALNGQLLDHAKKPLTLDKIEEYRQQVQTINA